MFLTAVAPRALLRKTFLQACGAGPETSRFAAHSMQHSLVTASTPAYYDFVDPACDASRLARRLLKLAAPHAP
jgi:hypothetical protein